MIRWYDAQPGTDYRSYAWVNLYSTSPKTTISDVEARTYNTHLPPRQLRHTAASRRKLSEIGTAATRCYCHGMRRPQLRHAEQTCWSFISQKTKANTQTGFLPRDAMRKRGLCCRPVCLSVCPSVRHVRCIQTARDIVKLLSQSLSPFILVFWLPSAGTQFQGKLLQRGRNIHGVGKICDFRLKSSFISETVRDRPMVAT